MQLHWKLSIALLAGIILGFAAGHFLASGIVQMEKQEECLQGSIQTVFSPGADDEILSLIRGAKESIDVEMYLFSYDPLADELILAKKRGVEVRVILEPRLSGSNDNLDTVKTLRDSGVDARWATLEYKLTHTKAMIIDKKKVLVGSTNWSSSALKKNREYSVLIEDERIVMEFFQNFEKDWEKASAG
jgi:cardiolipin synthase A/B